MVFMCFMILRFCCHALVNLTEISPQFARYSDISSLCTFTKITSNETIITLNFKKKLANTDQYYLPQTIRKVSTLSSISTAQVQSELNQPTR